MSTWKGPVFSMKKDFKIEWILSAAALALICFTLGFFLGRNSLMPGAVTIETEQRELSEEQPEEPAALEEPEPSAAVPNGTEPSAVLPNGTEADAPSGEGKSDEAGGLLNLNTATAAELETLPGIGAVLAQRIVDYRTEHGPFSAVEDIMKVSGIGDKKYEAIESLITVR